ncbi:D-cysteine desulfhydrase family protein [Chryseobacterium sp. BIGb0232]|uniref:D-cysteine desulfhydrase family protein n=1 Tax=Chryseobacterium sp. BIGb0232 TaxID=2940598 RepID=UPI000F4968BC|nr:D-cysteine desulfhydrase family protein [Chryseobacterium sp. BIGb0232]MCS4301029.1 D-cysteine desulfhydrase [Chryseobacterium sp. BIGb0232]ROS20106.1 D-cysteine desulfhydrase [Chryseobacterium nakagawai]
MEKNKIDLGFFPTPFQKLENLSKLYPDYSIYIKRDDNTGLASGGNKTRKLEFLIQQALEEGCDTVITAGAQQSNHCRQTAAACAKMGLQCHLLLGGDQPDTYDGNLLLSSLLGAAIHFTGKNRKGEDIKLLKEKLERQGNKCFIIPYGGSNSIGALGFVHAVEELKQQLAEKAMTIDYIFFASSSGGMQAGLTAGKALYDLNAELIPISIDKDETNGVSLEEVVFGIVQELTSKLNISKKTESSEIVLNRDYDSAGYGVLTANERYAIDELAKNEGILLDPVYTGRAFYGMLDFLKNKKLPAQSNVLFWHTGGLPAVFTFARELSNTL